MGILHFGAGDLTLSGISLARLHNISINITYDTAPLRGGSRIFPDNVALYNGNIEGTFEIGEIELTAIGRMLNADIAASAITVTSVQSLLTGMDLVVSGETNGNTSTITLYNCMFPGLTLNIDRENYLMPSTNFIVAGETSASGGRVITISNV